MGKRDYTIYAFPKKGIKFSIYPGPWKSIEELENQRATLKRNVLDLVEAEIQSKIKGHIVLDVVPSYRKPHTTLRRKARITIPNPDGTSKEFVPDGSDPNEAESQDSDAAEAVDFTHKLNERTAKLEQDTRDIKDDLNQAKDDRLQTKQLLREHSETMKDIAGELVTNGKVLAGFQKSVLETDSAILTQLAQLTGQVGSLVQALLQQQQQGST
jgi:hypothetical protein